MTVTISNKKKLSEYTFADLKDFFYDLSRKISSKVILLEIGNDFFNIALAKSQNGKLLIKKVYKQNLPKEAIEKSLPSDPVAFGSTILGVLKELKLSAQRVAVCISSDSCYTRLIEIPENINEQDALNYLENPDSNIQIPISLNNSDFDINLTNLDKKIIDSKSFNKYFLTSIPKKNANQILSTIKNANLELCSIQMSHNCTANLLRKEIDNLPENNLIISIELLDEFTQLVIFDKSGPIHIKRLGSIRNYPTIEEMKRINSEDKDNSKSSKASGYLPLSNLDLKILIREIKRTFKDFLEENKIEKNAQLFLSGRNSQHKNIVEILGKELSMDTFLVSPPGNYWLNEFTYNPDDVNQFSMSRIVGLGLSLINDFDPEGFLKSNSSFIINKYINNDDFNNLEKLHSKNQKLSNINIKENKEKNKVKPKLKKEEPKKVEDLPPLPNIDIKENKLKPKSKKESDLQNKKDQIKDKKGFKMDTSFLDIN